LEHDYGVNNAAEIRRRYKRFEAIMDAKKATKNGQRCMNTSNATPIEAKSLSSARIIIVFRKAPD
jgi:hypothetical protein